MTSAKLTPIIVRYKMKKKNSRVDEKKEKMNEVKVKDNTKWEKE